MISKEGGELLLEMGIKYGSMVLLITFLPNHKGLGGNLKSISALHTSGFYLNSLSLNLVVKAGYHIKRYLYSCIAIGRII